MCAEGSWTRTRERKNSWRFCWQTLITMVVNCPIIWIKQWVETLRNFINFYALLRNIQKVSLQNMWKWI